MSAVEAYLQANADFEKAKAEVASIGEHLRTFANRLLQNPEQTSFANSGIGLPMDIVLSDRTMTFDAGQWPTPDQIQSAIARRFDAKRKVQTAWAAIPEAMTASVVAPKL